MSTLLPQNRGLPYTTSTVNIHTPKERQILSQPHIAHHKCLAPSQAEKLHGIREQKCWNGPNVTICKWIATPINMYKTRPILLYLFLGCFDFRVRSVGKSVSASMLTRPLLPRQERFLAAEPKATTSSSLFSAEVAAF